MIYATIRLLRKSLTTNLLRGIIMNNTIDITKNLSSERWGEFFDQFTDGNRGRHISIECIDLELGDNELIQNAPLMAIVYDRPGKGNALIIEVGKSEVTYAHTVDAPTEILTAQDSLGQIMAISISDAAGTKTIVKLQAG
jgi:Family of unknown function (DUF5335)